MVYEIFFEPSVGQWRIRIITYYLLVLGVSRVVHTRKGTEPEASVAEFDTYAAAEKYVTDRGIDRAYVRRDRLSHYSAWLNGQGAHAAST